MVGRQSRRRHGADKIVALSAPFPARLKLVGRRYGAFNIPSRRPAFIDLRNVPNKRKPSGFVNDGVNLQFFMYQDEETVPHHSQNRNTAASKLRRGGKNCPVCLAALRKNVTRTRLLKTCVQCQAQPSSAFACLTCRATGVWQNKTAAACASCGRQGKKSEVIVKL